MFLTTHTLGLRLAKAWGQQNDCIRTYKSAFCIQLPSDVWTLTDYRVGVDEAEKYSVVLTSVKGRFGSSDNVKSGGRYSITPCGIEQ